MPASRRLILGGLLAAPAILKFGVALGRQLDVEDFGASPSATAAVNNPFIQMAIATAYNRGGGLVRVPRIYSAHDLILPEHVTLQGEGQSYSGFKTMDIDATLITVLAGHDASIRDMSLYGRNDPSATHSTLVVSPGVVRALFTNVRTWFGSTAISQSGCDCIHDGGETGNSYGLSAVFSQGANWYRNHKIDSIAAAIIGGKPATYYAFLHGTPAYSGVCENHLTDCDLSGCYDASMVIDDPTHQTLMAMAGCVASGPLNFLNIHTAMLTAVELGGNVYNPNHAPLGLQNCRSVGVATVTAYNATAPGAVPGSNMGVMFASN